MANIKFDYIEAADQMAEKGDYESALHYYFLGKSNGPDDFIDVCIGDTYAAMGLKREAIKYYMRAYAANQDNDEAVSGLIFCYKDIDYEAAFYYLHCVLKNSDEDFDLDMYEDDVPELSVHDRRDKSEAMDMAYLMLDNGDVESARETLRSIGKDSYQYCDSLLALASLEMENSNVDEAQRLADEALSVEPKHIGIHMLKIVAYLSVGDKASADEWIKKLDALDPRDEDSVTRLSLCFTNYEYYEPAKKYLLRKLEFNPYDKISLLCLCKIYVWEGSTAAAWKTANRVCAIYPDDVEAKELSTRILSNEEIRMPDEVLNLKREWTTYIKDLFLVEGSDFSAPENIRRIKWLLQSGEDLYLQSAVCAFVTGMPEYDSIINDVLIDPFAQSLVKKQILLRRLCDEKTKRIKVVLSNLFRSYKVRHPNAPDNLKYAYYYAFIALAVTELNFDRKLNAAFKRLHEKYTVCNDDRKEDLPLSALAAKLYSMTVRAPDKFCCNHFDCKLEDLIHVSEMLDL